MIKAIIAEDETGSAQLIQGMVAGYNHELQICAICTTVLEAVEQVRFHNPDIIFLDIELADGLGFELLEQIPDLEPYVIFITAYEHYALKAIKFNAFDYILKPVVPEELQLALQKAIQKIENQGPLPDHNALIRFLQTAAAQKVAVPSKNGLIYYPIDDIVFIEGDGSYAIMHFTNTKNEVITRKIKDFEKSLADKGFMRVHKSFLVNMSHITELHRNDSGYLLMSNKEKVPISPASKEVIIRKIRERSNII